MYLQQNVMVFPNFSCSYPSTCTISKMYGRKWKMIFTSAMFLTEMVFVIFNSAIFSLWCTDENLILHKSLIWNPYKWLCLYGYDTRILPLWWSYFPIFYRCGNHILLIRFIFGLDLLLDPRKIICGIFLI